MRKRPRQTRIARVWRLSIGLMPRMKPTATPAAIWLRPLSEFRSLMNGLRRPTATIVMLVGA
jgi:hypothetical protein